MCDHREVMDVNYYYHMLTFCNVAEHYSVARSAPPTPNIAMQKSFRSSLTLVGLVRCDRGLNADADGGEVFVGQELFGGVERRARREREELQR